MLKTLSFIKPFMFIKLPRPVPLVEKRSPGTRAVKKYPWHAVSIVRGRPSCDAACQLNARRWLSTQAPQLPLQGCSAAQCSCHYRHHEDRRVQERRESGVTIASQPPNEGERRSADTDRRIEISIQ